MAKDTTKMCGIMDIGMGDLENTPFVEYKNGDIAILSNISEVPNINSSVRLGVLMLAICKKGTCMFDLNGRTYKLKENDMFVGLPNSVISNSKRSDDSVCNLFVFSYNFIIGMMHESIDLRNKFLYIYNNPVIHISQEYAITLEAYNKLLTIKIKSKQQTYHKEIMKFLFQASMYELCSGLSTFVPQAEDDLVRQSDIVFRGFMRLLLENKKKGRCVSYYSNQLNVTPKYLTVVSKKISGKSAMVWITETLIEEIRYKLKYTTKSVKEISDEMDFPNVSFFGRFVKKNLGVSPVNYRKNIMK